MGEGRAIQDVPSEWNSLTSEVLGAAFEVHSTLGTGLLERLYGDALEVEFACRHVAFRREVPLRMKYKGVDIGDQVMDFIVGEVLILEIKAVERVADVHLAQLVSYLRGSGLPLGLLLNFHAPRLKDGIFRRVNSTATPVPAPLLELPDSALPPRPSASSAFKTS